MKEQTYSILYLKIHIENDMYNNTPTPTTTCYNTFITPPIQIKLCIQLFSRKVGVWLLIVPMDMFKWTTHFYSMLEYITNTKVVRCS
jgi:hypothetical protein